MTERNQECPDCHDGFDRRGFLRSVGATAAAAAVAPLLGGTAKAAPTPKSPAETAVKGLYEILTDEQRKAVCFDWNFVDPNPDPNKNRGLLRSHGSGSYQRGEAHLTLFQRKPLGGKGVFWAHTE